MSEKRNWMLIFAFGMALFAAGSITLENWGVFEPKHIHPYTESEKELIELQSTMIADLNIQTRQIADILEKQNMLNEELVKRISELEKKVLEVEK